MIDNSSSSKIGKITLADVVDLSFVQIHLLNILYSFTTGAIRFALLNQMNDAFFQDRPLARSTFYNSLQKLEEKGFVAFQEDSKSGRAKSVIATPLGKIATKMITQMMVFNIWDIGAILKDSVPQIIAKTELTPVHSMLLIHFDELMTIELLDDFYYPYSEELYVMTDDEGFNRYLKRGITRIHQSKFQRNRIREPKDFFDIACLVRYRKTDKFGISETEMLQEGLRVTKSGGKIIIVTISDISQANHFVPDSFSNFVNQNPFFFTISENKLRDDFTEVGIKDPNITNINGILVAWVIVP